jgi:hypothetical protein
VPRVWIVLKWAAVVVVASFGLVYLGDDLSVRTRMSHRTATDPVETLSLRPVYAVPRKDGKAEFDFGDPQTQTCVHAIFPHLGYNPCWYLLRASRTPIPITMILSSNAPVRPDRAQ